MILYQDVDVSPVSRRKEIAPDTQLVANRDAGHPFRLILNYSKPSMPGLDLPGVVEAMLVNNRVLSKSAHLNNSCFISHSPLFILGLFMVAERAVRIVSLYLVNPRTNDGRTPLAFLSST